MFLCQTSGRTKITHTFRRRFKPNFQEHLAPSTTANMTTMEDSAQTSMLLQTWKREQEEQRQYHHLRRRRHLQTERQHQRQRLVMAAMEQHERRRKRYQRALDQRRQGENQQHTRGAARQPISMQDTRRTVVEKHDDPVADKVTKLATLTTIKHQLDNCMRHFLDDDKQHSSGTTMGKATTTTARVTQWTVFKRLVILLVYEDMVMRLLLRLDGVSSDGDDGIRQQRKALVKRTSGFLDRLDQYKQQYVGYGGGL